MIKPGVIYEVPDEFSDPEIQRQVFEKFQEYMQVASKERRRIISDEQLIKKIHKMERPRVQVRTYRSR